MKRINAVLGLLLLMQSMGYSMIFYQKGSKLASYLFLEQSWLETHSRIVDYTLIGVMAISVLVSLLRPHVIPLLLLFFVFISEAYFSLVLGGAFASELSLMAQFARYSWPLILVFSISGENRWFSSINRQARFFLQLAIGMTFIAHGLEALNLAPKFIDFLVIGWHSFFSLSLSQGQAEFLLRGIGVIDVLLGIWVVFKPQLGILIYMGIWGFATAYMRIVFSAWLGVPDFLIRTAHWALPIIIAISLSPRISLKKAEMSAQPEPAP